MQSIKQSFPDETALYERLDAVWGDLSSKLYEETYGERMEMQKYHRPMWIFGVLTVALLLVIWLIKTDVITVVTAFIMAAFALYNGYYWYEAAASYGKKLNTHMYALVFRFFELKADYFGDDGDMVEANGDARVETLLKKSELITDRIDKTNVGDVFSAQYEGNELFVGEVHATRTEGSGKNRRTVEVFKGLFVEYTLGKTLSGTTFISTEGDERGFGHRNFWGRVTGKAQVEETELEWNAFEKDLHVATSDPTEARYILTPDLMQDLHDWWQDSKRNMRIVFKGNKMTLLFPDKKVQVAGLVTMLGKYELQEYAMTIIFPLWHVLRLLEDIDERFG